MAITKCTKCKKKRETRKAGPYRLCEMCWDNAGGSLQAEYPSWRKPPPDPSVYDTELAKQLGLIKDGGVR